MHRAQFEQFDLIVLLVFSSLYDSMTPLEPSHPRIATVLDGVAPPELRHDLSHVTNRRSSLEAKASSTVPPVSRLL